MIKKITLLLLFVVAFSWQGNAQFIDEGFEGGFPPPGWTIYNNGTGNDWELNTSSAFSNTGSNSAKYRYDADNAADAWMFTGAVTLGAGETVDWSFFTRSRGYTEKLKFTVGSSATVADQTTVLVDISNDASSYGEQSGTFTAATAGDYYFAFNCYSAANQFDLFVDDVLIKSPPTTPPNCDATLTTTTNASITDMSWSAATGSPTGYKIQVGTATGLDDVVAAGTDVGNNTSYTFATALNGGTTYYTTITSYNANGDATGCSEQSFTTFIPPANDDCSGAIALTVNSDLACGTVASGTLLYATASGVDESACSGTENDDVWFSFVATKTYHQIKLTNVAGTPTDLYHSVWEGSCGSLALVSGSCSDSNTSAPSGLTIGNTYYVRVNSYSSNTGASSTFDICIGTFPPAPANDDCSGAIALTVNSDLACGTVASGTLASATASGVDESACSGTENDDVWYSFVATDTTHQIKLTNIAGSPTSLRFSIWEGSCGSLALVSGSCSTYSVEIVQSGLTVGNTYYMRIYSYSSSAGATSTFDICIGTFPPAPANDDCSGAIALTVNSDVSCGTVTSGTLASATASGVDESACSGTENDDVWYSFVATDTTHQIKLTNVAGSPTDLYHSVWEGSCGSLALVSGSCSDSNTSTPSGLTIGNTYYVRVNSYSSSASATSTFDICVGTFAFPPAVTPDYSNEFDTYPGDGWRESEGAFGTIDIYDTTSGWTEDDYLNDTAHTNGQAARINIFGTTTDEYLITVPFDLSASTYYLNYEIGLTDYSGGGTDTMSSDDYLSLLVSQDDGATWTELKRWTSADNLPNTGMHAPEITLTGYGASTLFAFYAFSDTSNTDYNVYIDNFSVTSTTLGVANTTISGFAYYPNPVNDQLSLRANNNIDNVILRNILGQTVLTVAPSATSTAIDMSQLKQGTYFVSVQVGDAIQTVKVMKN